MRHGSLFSGIGGFDLAAEWMGWENVFHCEWNPFGQKVLKHYWPHSISYNDITKTDFSIHRGEIDIITGGFPCQPYSSAGKRLGKEDSRHLWPEMCRAIREIFPSWIVGENVRGLTNWNGGMVFDEVCADLENIGYQVTPFLIPACATNAPHKRERIWFIAYSESSRSTISKLGESETKQQIQTKCDINRFKNLGIATNSSDKGLERGKVGGSFGESRSQSYKQPSRFIRATWQNFPTVPPVCNGNDGLPNRLDGITFPKWRNESIKAGGNAVVPQVVYQIFKSIEHYGIQNPGCDKS